STARSGRHANVVGKPHRVETGCFGKLRDSDRPHFLQRSSLQKKVVLVPITDAVRGSVDSDVHQLFSATILRDDYRLGDCSPDLGGVQPLKRSTNCFLTQPSSY